MEFLFLDLDDTILDFHGAEKKALSKTLAAFGLEPTAEVCDLYHTINQRHWQMLERGELTREQVLRNRFGVLFQQLGQTVDEAAVAKTYERLLAREHDYLPGSEETVKQVLFGRYRLFLASNGTASVQHGRLTGADLYPYFEAVFVSQELGYNKPDVRYFQAAFAKIADFDRKKAMIVGDSLTSDILGGRQAGIATCWVNPRGETAPPDCQPDHIIKSLADLPMLLKKM